METLPVTSERDPYLWKQAKARVGFYMHRRSYLIINTGLWLIWAVPAFYVFQSSDGATLAFPWPVFATLGWGIGLASHYFAVYRSGDGRSLIEREYQRLKNQS